MRWAEVHGLCEWTSKKTQRSGEGWPTGVMPELVLEVGMDRQRRGEFRGPGVFEEQLG